MSYKTLSDFDFQGKTVFVRADLNVPAKDGVITDMTRIDRFVPTLKEIAEKVGFKTSSAVAKRIEKIAGSYEDFLGDEYSAFLDKHSK